MVAEFKLIDRFFARHPFHRPDVILGIGDDAALVRPDSGYDLAMAVDTMVAGVHFPETTAPAAIGHKALAVNLSDMAAMGAEPLWATLSLTLPESDPEWVSAFCAGLFALADRHQVQLIGGDTTSGPLAVSVHITGRVPHGKGLRRGGARPGDVIYVTGTLGDGGIGLGVKQGSIHLAPDLAKAVVARLDFPEPRVAQGLALQDLAHSAIDISDGLVADLGHILQASEVGASVDVESLPVSAGFEALGEPDWRIPLTSGDDYELCFTVPPETASQVESNFSRHGWPVTRIGVIETDSGLRLRRGDGSLLKLDGAGYEHFGAEL